jgi:hypothetical protein
MDPGHRRVWSLPGWFPGSFPTAGAVATFGRPVDHVMADHLSTAIRMGDAVINKGNSDERHCRTG